MWLLGPAGAGKSAIAQTLAELCNSSKILLASFFFFRTDPARNHSRSLIATLAYQPARNLPDARDFVVKVPEGDPMVFTRSIEEQLSSLIINPLEELCRSGRPSSPSDPYLVIIDGLDECGDAAMQTSILQVITKAFSACKLPLKFLIASRPEMHLTSAFNSRWINPILARLALDDNFGLRMTSSASCRIVLMRSGKHTLLLPSFAVLRDLARIPSNIWSKNHLGNLYLLRPS